MWTLRTIEAETPDRQRFAVDRGGRPATFSDVVESWRDDAAFRAWFNETLAACPYTAFRWETPVVTTATAFRVFEFVVLDDPDLARRPDPAAFGDRFRAAKGEEILVFPNLGRDAVMVVPAPIAPPSAYAHLAAFVREAPERQRLELWRSVGEAMAKRIGEKPVWLSTAGAGVAWLHVRLADRPKYYGHGPYRRND